MAGQHQQQADRAADERADDADAAETGHREQHTRERDHRGQRIGHAPGVQVDRRGDHAGRDDDRDDERLR
ncbi:hypothetical protein D3C83_29570 [compost metagenome]